VAAAEGNPLFVEQILALQAEAPNEELSVPPTIQALLSARIDRLPPEERDVLARASIEGRLFHRGAVAELLPDDDRAQLGAALLSLVRKELLRPDRAFFSGDDGFRFSHVLIRDAAYNSTSKQLRAELHERYARWLEQRLGEAEIIGFHLEQAWGYRKELGAAPNALAQEAGQQLWNAAQATSLRMDTRAAAALYRRAAALLPDEPSGELLQEYGAALNRNGDPDGARPVVEQAIERTGRAENRRSELLARLDRLWIPLEGEQRRPNDEIRRRAEALIPELEARSDDLGLTKVWQVIAMSDWNSGRYESAEAALVHALRHARRLGDRLEESEVRVMLLSTWYDGDVPVDEVLRRCEEEIQRSPGDWMIEACALSYSSGMTAMRGEFDRARELIERSIALCGEFNIINVYPTFERRDVELLAGNFTGAEAWLRRAQQESFGIAEWWGVNLALGASLAVALCGQDRYDEVAHMTANVPSDTDGLIWGHVLSRRARARALARVGQPEEAAKLADEAVSLAERTDGLNQRADALLDRAEVADVLGRDDDAARDVAAALALYERKGNLVMAERARRFRAPPTPASRA